MASVTTAQVQAMLERVPHMDKQSLLTLRSNAMRFGDEAAPLVQAIEERLADFELAGGMAPHRLEFARAMLRIIERSPPLQWIASRDLFEKARVENADSPFIVWMNENSARKIPLTKALEEVLHEFPHLERRKEGNHQGARVYYRSRPRT